MGKNMIEYGPLLERLVANLYDFASFGFGDYRLGKIDEYLPHDFIARNVPYLKIISAAATMILVVLIAIFRAKAQALKESKKAGGGPSATPAPESRVGQAGSAPAISPAAGVFPGALTARWQEVVRHLESPVEAQWRFAIIEADKLVDDILRRAGFPGGSMGERLTNASPGQLETLEGLWEAHKLRNRLAHDVGYFLRYTEAKRAIGQFEATLRELNAL